uniref:MIF4G domain-containing protein n=1 Tax=Chromera velia CCMP2878 TaxID=1169474 RepID=A0A0G4FL17_9ALVE|eukprot:Cvel_17507.t1-p1 / transcript=Cvel_17507.t1 / gene=Cvel_17507 / organism=Chromera_velia_CCMP2878 / gene_product=Regulator of nonsense transcripts UPF2, putative / transcript_product=Regulator of nonsense transcripts UPF2, putative / location=Cvel_scaffold1402:18281-34398(+) / protein_length=1376 / sequence_SO=supercontig / SO=protein_coding / is_pseudo=false
MGGPSDEGSAPAMSDEELKKLKEEVEQRKAEEMKDDTERARLLEANKTALEGGRQLEGKRDKSIQKISNFKNRLKKIAESERKILLEEVKKLNVGMYLEELADAVSELNFKQKDLPLAVELCCALHQQYEGFTPALQKALGKAFQAAGKGVQGSLAADPAGASSSSSSSSSAGSGAVSALSGWTVAYQNELAGLLTKRKLATRLAGELYLTGVFEDEKLIGSILKLLCTPPAPSATAASADAQQDKEKDGQGPEQQPQTTDPSEDILQAHLACLEFVLKKMGTALLRTVPKKEADLNRQSKTKGEGEGAEGKEAEEGEDKRIAVAEKTAGEKMSALVKGFVRTSGRRILERAHWQMTDQEQRNHTARVERGVVEPEAMSRYQELRNAHQRVQTQLAFIADLVCEEMPRMVDAAEKEGGVRLAAAETAETGKEKEAEEKEEDPETLKWEDAGDRKFYEDVLDLKDILPGVLLGLDKEKEKERKEKEKEKKEKERDLLSESQQEKKKEKEKEKERIIPGLPPPPPAPTVPLATADSADSPLSLSAEAGEKENDKKGTEEETITDDDKKKEKEKETDLLSAAATPFDLFLLNLSRTEPIAEEIDKLAEEFFMQMNSKTNRKKLASHLWGNRRRPDLNLLPVYSRFIRLIHPYCREVGSSVLSALQKEFAALLNEKNPTEAALDAKIKNVRYLAELVKFGVAPAGLILDAFGRMLDDFTAHHVELAVNICIGCGRFLMYTKETSTRTQNLLDKMMRLKSARSVSTRLEVMIEDAYFQVRPTERKKVVLKERPVMRQFIDHVVHSMVYKEDEDSVLKLIRKLDWGDPKVVKWLRKAMLDLDMHGDYARLHCLACLLSGLARYRDAFVIEVIDGLMEDIQVSLEKADFRESPKRVRQVRLLGELYCYRLVDSAVIFDCLYHLIGLGGASAYQCGSAKHAAALMNENQRMDEIHAGGLGGRPMKAIMEEDEEEGEEEADDEEKEKLGDSTGPAAPLSREMLRYLWNPMAPFEPPNDFFRIRLVCMILQSIGQYFSKGGARVKLDRFLLFFQRYLLFRGQLPMRVGHLVKDTIEDLRPQMVLHKTLEESDDAILLVLQEEAKHLQDGDEDGIGGGDDEGEEEESTEEEESEEGGDSDLDSEDEDADGADDENEEDDPDYDRKRMQAAEEEPDEFEEAMKDLIKDSLVEARNQGASKRMFTQGLAVAQSKRGSGSQFVIESERDGDGSRAAGGHVPASSDDGEGEREGMTDGEAPRQSDDNEESAVARSRTFVRFGLLRRGGGVRGEVRVPTSDKLVRSAFAKRAGEEKEREEVKSRVMQAVGRQEEADYSEKIQNLQTAGFFVGGEREGGHGHRKKKGHSMYSQPGEGQPRTMHLTYGNFRRRG